MALADMIPTLDDKELGTLRDNARRLEASGGKRQQQAVELLPIIEAEVAARLALKPPPKKPAKPRAAKSPATKATKAAKAAS